MPAPTPHLFSQADVAAMRRDKLLRIAANLAPDLEVHDDAIVAKLRSAQTSLERTYLRVFLTPREVIPAGATREEEEALALAGHLVVREPGYDYDPAMFQGDRFGLVELRHTPVIAVRSINFAYPGLGASTWRVPAEWIRFEPKEGRVNLIPTGTATGMPFTGYLLGAMAGARNVPLMVEARYRSGLDGVAEDRPDIMDLIKKMAALSIVEDEYMPSSGSVSADGLSQSVSFAAKDYQEGIDAKIGAIKQSLTGIQCMVF